MQMMVTRSIDVFDPTDHHRRPDLGRHHQQRDPRERPDRGHDPRRQREHPEKVHAGIQRVAEGIAAAHDATVTVEITLGYPVTSNHNGFASFATGVAGDVIGAEQVIQLPHPVMGAEDFSYVLEAVPGSMMFLGGTPHGKNPATGAPNHSNRVMFDEQAMVTGMAVYTGVAIRHLAG